MKAKTELSPWEQHIEKIVLGVAALFLLIAAASWGLSTPSAEIGDSEVALGEMDERLRTVADRKLSRARQETPPVPEPPAFAETIANLLYDPVPPALQPMDVGFAEPAIAKSRPPQLPDYPPVKPIAIETGPGPEGITIASVTAKIPPMPAPRISIRRESIQTEPIRDLIVGRGVTVLPIEDIRKAWRNLTLGRDMDASVMPVNVVIEREERLPDGTWGNRTEIRGVTIGQDGSTVSALDLTEQVPQYDGTNRDQVRRELERQFRDLRTAEDVLQPEYWNIFVQSLLDWDSWQRHLPENEITDLAKAEGLEPAGGYKRMRRTPTRTRPKARPNKRTRPNRVPYDLEELQRLELEMMPGMEPMGPPVRRPRPRPKPKPKPTPKKTAPEDATLAGQEDLPFAPPFDWQMEKGKLMVWFHDTSLEPSKEYRYRMRVVLVNPLLGYDDPQQARPEDAKQRLIRTEFTPWSDAAAVPETRYIYLTGGHPAARKVRVTVMMKRMGQTLKADFMVGKYDPIGGKRKVDVVDLVTGETSKQEIDFHTGAVVLDLDFNKQVVLNNITRDTAEMVFADEDGKLNRVVKVTDLPRDSVPRKLYEDLVRQAKPAVAAVGG